MLCRACRRAHAGIAGRPWQPDFPLYIYAPHRRSALVVVIMIIVVIFIILRGVLDDITCS